MPLNKVQRDFVNQTARPQLETMIAVIDAMETFVTDYDANQSGDNALPQTTDPLDDNIDGTAPRADAPNLTGAQLKLLRDRCETISNVLSPTEKQTLIDKMVRSLATVRGIIR